MASLDPAPGWTPNADRALERLTPPLTQPVSPWMRLGMTATILATTVFVLVMLPWQKLWTPEPATAPEVKAAAAVLQEPSPPPAPALPQAETEPSQNPAGEVINRHVTGGPETKDEMLELSQAHAEKRGVTVPAPQAPPPTVIQPEVVTRVNPEYTAEARQAKVVGTVELIVTIRTDGSVQVESVKSGLGYGLDDKAREAVEKWKFTPGQKDGVPVPTTVVINVNFSLR